MKTEECTPFWCTLLVFKRADRKFFMLPIVVKQAKEYYQYIHHNIPLDETVHHTPSGYMYRDGWLKAMTQLSNICGASPVKNQILFFNGHSCHFDNRALTKIQKNPAFHT